MWKNKYTLEYCYSLDDLMHNYHSYYLDDPMPLEDAPAFTTLFGYLFKSTAIPSTYWSSGKGKDLWELIYQLHFDDIVAFNENVLSNTNYQEIFKTFGRRFYSIWTNTHDKYEFLIDSYSTNKAKLLDKIKKTIKTTGDETTSHTGDDTFTKEGSETTEGDVTRTGSVDSKKNQTNTVETFTNDTPQNAGSYDDTDYTSLYNKQITTPSGQADTTTYNSVKDDNSSTLSFEDRIDTTSYNSESKLEHNTTVTEENDLTTLMSRLDEINRLYKNVYARWAKEFKGLFISHLNYEEV